MASGAEAVKELGALFSSDPGDTTHGDAQLPAAAAEAAVADAEAHYERGLRCAKGDGVAAGALECFTRAAELGHAEAQCRLGRCYTRGEGVSRDFERAAQWYTKAAEQGHAGAQGGLGLCYYTGKGVAQNFERAVAWYTKAALQNHAGAQRSLGVCYDNGQGVELSEERAVELYTKAAKQGDTDAQSYLKAAQEKAEREKAAREKEAKEKKEKEEKEAKEKLHRDLDVAACAFDVEACRYLIKQGADANHVFHKGANGWYSGDTTTCLFNAISSFRTMKWAQKKKKKKKKTTTTTTAKTEEEEEEDARVRQQTKFVDTAIFLLESGSSPTFSAMTGNWSRCSYTPLGEMATDAVQLLTTFELKRRFLQGLADAGVKLNEATHRVKQKNCYSVDERHYPIFRLVEELANGEGDFEMVKVYIECGIDVNCVQSGIYQQFDESDDECDDDDDDDGEKGVKVQKHAQSLLHAAIKVEHEELVRLLLAKGADPNVNEVFTKRGKFYCQSCLEHALSKGNSAVAQMLVDAGAKEAVHTPCPGVVRSFGWGKMYRRGGGSGADSNPGADMWTQMEEEGDGDNECY